MKLTAKSVGKMKRTKFMCHALIFPLPPVTAAVSVELVQQKRGKATDIPRKARGQWARR
jgi:hypothetical protein